MADQSIFIKFDPEKISNIAFNLDLQKKRMTELINSIQGRAEALEGSWQGDSAALYLEKMRGLHVSGRELANVLSAFSQDLVSASGIYEAGETGAKQKAEALPTDGVFLV
ncbi:MAG TPA: WXG100 family type VII secretion target [Anaerovoracaceae bacterium]|nr:WXG100 family type VII secretion target [Anaerovoracaceae bacterium]